MSSATNPLSPGRERTLQELVQDLRQDRIESLIEIKRQQDQPPADEYQPQQRGDLIGLSEPEVVPGQHQRDGVIHRVELVGGRYFRLRCRAMTAGKNGYMRVFHTATYLSYIFSFDAAEAWAYRGEIPTMSDGRAITVESR